jgi:hypothetical protein
MGFIMSRRRRRILAMAAAIVVVILLGVVLLQGRLLDGLYALKTGYFFEWMPEGVIPVIGRSIWAVGSNEAAPVLWVGTTPRDLGLPPGYSQGMSRAINSRGQIPHSPGDPGGTDRASLPLVREFRLRCASDPRGM